MKRHAAKRRPKHIRRLVSRLSAAGYSALVEVGPRGYLVSWQASGERMRLGLSLSGGGDSIERLWAAIRALFRARGLAVPA